MQPRWIVQPETAVERVAEVADDGSSWYELLDVPAPGLMRLAKADDGRLVCTALILGGHPGIEINAQLLRKIKLAHIVTTAAGGAGDEVFQWLLPRPLGVANRVAVATLLATLRVRRPGLTSGAKGNRTPDLFHAMEALYQLSYSPVGSPI
ncbi:MAG: hypothetical protein JWM47_663 [Acidimicrobiales bacterium]|nr:hypothetical protein [Acidimicrobiales bacterium]